LSLAPIFKIAVPFEETLMLLGRAENSIGLSKAGYAFPLSSVVELLLDNDKGPLITAAVFTKVKSTSKSWGPKFLKGILNFWLF
jgi:hypothetical protein